MLGQKVSTKPTHTLGVKHNKQARKIGVRHNLKTSSNLLQYNNSSIKSNLEK